MAERGAAAFSFARNACSRDGRPSHGSCSVARASATASDRRRFAEHFGPERRVDRPPVCRPARRPRRESRRGPAPRRRRSHAQRRRLDAAPARTCAARAVRSYALHEDRGLLRAPVDEERSRAARRRRSDRRTGCSAGTAARRAARSSPCRMATASPIRSMTLARRAANSSGGKISSPVNTGCAASHDPKTRTRAAAANEPFLAPTMWIPSVTMVFHSDVVQAFRPARHGGPEGPHYDGVKTL